jgi:ferrochelatase
MSKTVGVLMMAYGGPDTLEDVQPFLADIRHGRPTPPELLEEITERYRAIGGRSPILEITSTQARGVEQALNADANEVTFKIYVGMRHWHPYIEDVVPRMIDDGVDEIVAVVMAPHFSRMSVGAYMGKVDKALHETKRSLRVTQVESWKAEPAFIAAVAARIEDAFATHYPDVERDSVPVIFTAHSLPARILESNDPYREEILESVELVAARLGLKNYRFAFQSQGATADPWLGPSVEETLDELHAEDVDKLLLVPIGFVCDHVEVLFDVDIEHRHQAEELGIRLERTAMLNDDPGLVTAIASAVRQALAQPV